MSTAPAGHRSVLFIIYILPLIDILPYWVSPALGILIDIPAETDIWQLTENEWDGNVEILIEIKQLRFQFLTELIVLIASVVTDVNPEYLDHVAYDVGIAERTLAVDAGGAEFAIVLRYTGGFQELKMLLLQNELIV